jgi:hypothetical protein
VASLSDSTAAEPGRRKHNSSVDEDLPADNPAIVITWRALPAVCTAACAVFLLVALVVAFSAPERVTCGLLAVFFAVAALVNFRRRYELGQGHAGFSPDTRLSSAN